MADGKLYTTAEVAEIIGIQKQSILKYHRTYGIGRKIHGANGRDYASVMYTYADIEKIRNTDGRRK